MALRSSISATAHNNVWTEEDYQTPPVSPMGRILNTEEFSLCIHSIAEYDEPIDVSKIKQVIQDILLPHNPRFSSIMTEDEDGVMRWEKTEVNVNDHVFVPEFPPGLEEYDEYVNGYISDMHLRRLPHSRPLWEFHFLNYKTSTAAATSIFNVHHKLGDGASLTSLALACSKMTHNPTFPTPEYTDRVSPQIQDKPQVHWFSSEFLHKVWHRLFTVALIMWYTVLDLCSDLLRVKLMDDSELPIRGPPGVEWTPKVMSSTTFKMEDVQHIKKSVGGTLNDVIMGVVFCGLQRYLRITLGETSSFGPVENLRVTALALMNTRPLSGPKDLKKPNSQKPSGNRFGFLHVRMPMEKLDNPLDFVRRTKRIIDRMKLSFAVFITGKALRVLTKLKGPKASAKYLYNTLTHTTLTVTNIVGPTERYSAGGPAVKNFYFSVSGVPQALLVTVVSYVGNVRVQIVAARGYVDAALLSNCFAICFQEMKEATI